MSFPFTSAATIRGTITITITITGTHHATALVLASRAKFHRRGVRGGLAAGAQLGGSTFSSNSSTRANLAPPILTKSRNCDPLRRGIDSKRKA
jgi:hypothetical protein